MKLRSLYLFFLIPLVALLFLVNRNYRRHSELRQEIAALRQDIQRKNQDISRVATLQRDLDHQLAAMPRVSGAVFPGRDTGTAVARVVEELPDLVQPTVEERGRAPADGDLERVALRIRGTSNARGFLRCLGGLEEAHVHVIGYAAMRRENATGLDVTIDVEVIAGVPVGELTHDVNIARTSTGGVTGPARSSGPAQPDPKDAGELRDPFQLPEEDR